MKKNSKHSKAVNSGSRFSEPTSKKKKKTKSNSVFSNINIKKILIIIIIIIIIFGIIKITYNINNQVTVSDDMIKISSSKKVENLENIEITNLTIEKKESAYSIKLNFKNNSDKKQDTFQSYINLLNKDDNIVLGLYFYVPEIPANSEKECTIISSRDLTETHSYTIEKRD